MAVSKETVIEILSRDELILKILYFIIGILIPGAFYIMFFQPGWIVQLDVLKILLLIIIFSSPFIYLGSMAALDIYHNIPERKRPKGKKGDLFLLVGTLLLSFWQFFDNLLLTFIIYYISDYAGYKLQIFLIYWGFIVIRMFYLTVKYFYKATKKKK